MMLLHIKSEHNLAVSLIQGPKPKDLSQLIHSMPATGSHAVDNVQSSAEFDRRKNAFPPGDDGEFFTVDFVEEEINIQEQDTQMRPAQSRYGT